MEISSKVYLLQEMESNLEVIVAIPFRKEGWNFRTVIDVFLLFINYLLKDRKEQCYSQFRRLYRFCFRIVKAQTSQDLIIQEIKVHDSKLLDSLI